MPAVEHAEEEVDLHEDVQHAERERERGERPVELAIVAFGRGQHARRRQLARVEPLRRIVVERASVVHPDHLDVELVAEHGGRARARAVRARRVVEARAEALRALGQRKRDHHARERERDRVLLAAPCLAAAVVLDDGPVHEDRVDLPALEEVVAEVNAAGGTAVALEQDVTDPDRWACLPAGSQCGNGR